MQGSKKDKFTKKYSFTAFGINYRSKTGSDDLPQVKDDIPKVRKLIKKLQISPENQFELIDPSHEQIEGQYEQLFDLIVPQTSKLLSKTSIGSTSKHVAGIPWRLLKPFAMKLIQDGVIKVQEKKGVMKVDTSTLESIEVK